MVTYHYAYDTAGNRCANATSCASPTFTYNAANELTASPSGSGYIYDANGNETAGYATIAGTSTAISLAYNNRNQTSAITCWVQISEVPVDLRLREDRRWQSHWG